MSTVRSVLVKLHWLFSSQLGLDPHAFFEAVVALPRFVRDWLRFRSAYGSRVSLMPCLHDWYSRGDATHSEYFWQDLLVARWVFAANPRRHVDVGSRIDGFVAHLASFREVEMLDVRPVSRPVPGVTFKRADLMQRVAPAPRGEAYCDSLSCLHALEHFGLGRYGDPLDPIGYERGIANMAGLLERGGRFYLSTPIGRERVEFNANRVFDPRTIIRCAQSNGLRLDQLTVVGADGLLAEAALSEQHLQQLAQDHYNLGIFIFTKTDRQI